MGLDIWSYDKDEISDFGKYNYLKNKYDIFITNKDSLQGRHIYPNNINTTQYLRSAYNQYGYNRMASIYNCIPMDIILQPIFICVRNNSTSIPREAILESLGIASYNLLRWEQLNDILSKNGLLYRPKVLEYYKNPEDNSRLSINAFDYLYTTYIIYNSTTKELVDNARNNMRRFKYKRYIDKYQDNENSLKGIIKLNNNIIGLYQDDLNYYVETAQVIVEFIKELLSMEEPVVNWWG